MTKLHKGRTLYLGSFPCFQCLPSNLTVVLGQPMLGAWLKEGCAWQDPSGETGELRKVVNIVSA